VPGPFLFNVSERYISDMFYTNFGIDNFPAELKTNAKEIRKAALNKLIGSESEESDQEEDVEE
jgi:hypothetical protein